MQPRERWHVLEGALSFGFRFLRIRMYIKREKNMYLFLI